MKCQLCEETRGIQSCHIIPRACDWFFGYFFEWWNENNRLFLCPNHHFYFDHDLLTAEEFGKIEGKIKEVVSQFFRLVERKQEKLRENNLETESLEKEIKCYLGVIRKNKTLGWLIKDVKLKDNEVKPLEKQGILN